MTETGSSVAAWLVETGELPSIADLRATRLAAYAYTVLPQTHPSRAILREDYVASFGRHQRVKADLLPLLRAWRHAGVDVLLFKGFHLSEFVYPRPGARFHGDVDLLLRPDHVTRAWRIARETGWYSALASTSRFRQSHAAFWLARARTGTRIDVHRQMLHVVLPWYPAQRRITDAVWQQSRTRWWEGVEIFEPSPVDMILVALVLQRCWSAERWQLKPHDILDFHCITAEYGVTRDDLWTRARALRCGRTLGAFLDRCDPRAARLDVSPISAKERRRLDMLAFRERGPLGVAEQSIARVVGAPVTLTVGLRFVPLVLRVRRALRRHADLRALLDTLCPNERELGSRRQRKRAEPREAVSVGVHWAVRLVGGGRFGECLVRALATFVALRQRGWPVEFVSGVRRTGSTIVGHAWVEYAGGVLLEIEQPHVCAKFEQNFRFPPPPMAAAPRGRSSTAPIRFETATSEPVSRTPPG